MPRSRSVPRLHDAAADKSTSSFTRLYRLTRLLLQIVYGCVGVAVLFPFFSHNRRRWAIRFWSRQALGILHLRLTVHGSLPSSHVPTLIVSNHVSWIDICILNTVLPLRFVAKSDVRRWPLVGFLVSRVGTIFIERRNPLDTVRTNRAIEEALTRGEHVAIFPEGTSTDGTELKPFHASLFQPGLGAVARVVAVAVRYVNSDGSVNLNASYAGERSLWESFRLVVARRSMHAELIFAGSIDVGGKTRGEIARAAECATADALQLPRPGGKTAISAGLPGEEPTALSSMDTPYPVRLRSVSAPSLGPTGDCDERSGAAQASWDREPGQDLLG
jgi:1-acyl-sn-glycerol-3-phosphate acyltransferase